MPDAPIDALEYAKLRAKELGAAVELTGDFPKSTAAQELFSLAIRECTSNCIRHAGGNEVQLRIAERNELYDITVTNNGRVPTASIREGSGLSGLRRRVEAAGGEMHTAYKPRFALLITLPGKENDL